jgi:hypothetical protein
MASSLPWYHHCRLLIDVTVTDPFWTPALESAVDRGHATHVANGLKQAKYHDHALGHRRHPHPCNYMEMLNCHVLGPPSRILCACLRRATSGNITVTVGRVNTARLLDMCGNHG